MRNFRSTPGAATPCSTMARLLATQSGVAGDPDLGLALGALHDLLELVGRQPLDDVAVDRLVRAHQGTADLQACFPDFCPPDLTRDLKTYGSQSGPR